MNPFVFHLKRHGIIHLFWMIAILASVVCWLLVATPGSQIIQSYIAFAATFASLFLAIVAIFYAIISSHSLSDSLSKTMVGSQRITEASERLNSISLSIAEETRILSKQVSAVPQSMRDLQEDLSKRFDQFSGDQVQRAGDNDTSKVNYPVNIAAHMSLYMMAKMYQSGIHANTEELKLRMDPRFCDMAFGFLSAMATFEPCASDISNAGSSFAVSSMGDLPEQEYLDRDFSELASVSAGVKEFIDSYFIKNDKVSDNK